MYRLYKAMFFIFSLTLFSFCGEGGSESDKITSITAEFTLTGNDRMQFNLQTMVVKEGDAVKINFENIGIMAKEVMGHNFVLLKQGVDLASFAAKAAAAKDNDYIPSDAADDIIIYSKLLGPGEKTIIEFQAPPKGAYKYFCSFPGHYLTMQGNFIVR